MKVKVFIFFALNLFSVLIMEYIDSKPSSWQVTIEIENKDSHSYRTNDAFINTILYILILGPALETVFFNSIIQNSLKYVFNNRIFIITIPAILFSIFHEINLINTIYTLIFGSYLCYLFLEFSGGLAIRSIKVFFIHSFANLISISTSIIYSLSIA